jgi:hypothetical protein
MAESPAPDFFMASMMTLGDSAEETAKGSELSNRGVKEQKYSDSFKVKYKTEMCKNWQETGHCEFFDSCSFAHGKFELLQKSGMPKNYKTKMCKKFHKDLFCPYGARCQFLHDEKLLSSGKQSLSQDVKAIKVVKPRTTRRRVQDEVAAAEPLLDEVRSALKVPSKRLQIFATITEL